MDSGKPNFRLHLKIGQLMLVSVVLVLAGCLNGENVLPRAFAGFDQLVDVGDLVKLDGSLSFDKNFDELTYAWVLTKPENSKAELELPDTEAPFFIADVAGTYVATLVVNDGVGDSAPDSVIITASVPSRAQPGSNHPEVTGTCESCHNGVDATGKSASHIPTSESCDACHTMDAWLPGSRVDHTQVIGACSSCHDGVIASGKSPNHIPTTEPCDTCHLTTFWVPVTAPGSPVPNPGNGQPQNHLPTTDRCEVCHSNGTFDPPVVFQHSEAIGTCESCHDGVRASGKSPSHVVTTRQCNVCHTTDAWVPAVDPATVREKPVNHLPTSSECVACHGVDWLQVVVVDHTQVIGTCVSCHDGVQASGKPPQHIASSDVCDACHEVFPANWRPVTGPAVDHTQVLGTCVSCHDGVQATGKSPQHIASSDVCDACHDTRNWFNVTNDVPAPNPQPDPVPDPGTSVPDHAAFTGNCITCHNGVDASGKGATHINTSEACDACHVKFPEGWVPVTVSQVDHSQVVGTCVSCHNNVIASGKSANHLTTTDTCDACHLPGPTPWVPVVPATVDHTQVIGVCSSCHDGVLASGLSPAHPPIGQQECDVCHSAVSWRDGVI